MESTIVTASTTLACERCNNAEGKHSSRSTSNDPGHSVLDSFQGSSLSSTIFILSARVIMDEWVQFADAVLALRSQMRPKSPAREAARRANVPVYAVKAGSPSALVRALQTLLGISLPPQSESSDDEEEAEPKNHVVSLVRSLSSKRISSPASTILK